VDVDEILTAPALTAAYLAEHYPGARCLLLNSGDISADLDDVTIVDDDPDVVVVGGAGAGFGYVALNRVFGHLQQGARLVATSSTPSLICPRCCTVSDPISFSLIFGRGGAPRRLAAASLAPQAPCSLRLSRKRPAGRLQWRGGRNRTTQRATPGGPR